MVCCCCSCGPHPFFAHAQQLNCADMMFCSCQHLAVTSCSKLSEQFSIDTAIGAPDMILFAELTETLHIFELLMSGEESIGLYHFGFRVVFA